MTLLDGQLWASGYGGTAPSPGQGHSFGRGRTVTWEDFVSHPQLVLLSPRGLLSHIFLLEKDLRGSQQQHP